MGPGAVFAHKRALQLADPFFDAGNEALGDDALAGLTVESAASAPRPETDAAGDFACAECAAAFASSVAHDAHYETAHAHECGTCHASFPNARLLDLHVSESHDSYFRAMAARRPMYECLAEGCAVRCTSDATRLDHLVAAHGYPPDFRFDPRQRRQMAKRVQKRMGQQPPPALPRADRSATRCRFFLSRKGCAKGLRCPFQHDAAGAAERGLPTEVRACARFNSAEGCPFEARCRYRHVAPSSAPPDVDMDDLAAGLAAVSVGVPERVRFGRHR